MECKLALGGGLSSVSEYYELLYKLNAGCPEGEGKEQGNFNATARQKTAESIK